jgi:PAS domain S-box-containing protein
MSTTEVPLHQNAIAPTAGWNESDLSGHVVQFYSADSFLLDSVSRFVGTALGAGDAAIVIATKAHRTQLGQRLKARGLDPSTATRIGRYVALDAAETLAKFMRDGHPDAGAFAPLIGNLVEQAHAAAESKPSRVVAFGEMVALLWAEGNFQAALELEQLWNELAQSHSFTLHCGYPLQGFSRQEHGEHLLNICHAHSGVIPSESYTALATNEERLRTITHLQQKAQALETETVEKRQIAQSLQRREAELADFLENAAEGVQQLAADHRIRWANNALLKLLGYAPEDYVNHSMEEFYVDPKRFDEFWGRLMHGEEVRDFSADLRCKDGSIKHVVIHSNALWDGARFLYTRCFIRDVTDQTRMEQELRESKVQLQTMVDQRTLALRRLSVRILGLQDAERRRIARELHDSLGQYLTGLKIDMEMLRQRPQSEQLWSQAEQLLGQCLSEVRTLSYLLHPPLIDEAGLSSAARWYLQGFGERSGIKVNLETTDDLDRLPDAVELALFRILQEALTNVHRHAGATQAEVRILRDAEHVVLEVKDNGQGFPKEILDRFTETGAGTGVGLAGIHERAHELGGSLHVESDKSGTTLLITIPVAPTSAETCAASS